VEIRRSAQRFARSGVVGIGVDERQEVAKVKGTVNVFWLAGLHLQYLLGASVVEGLVTKLGRGGSGPLQRMTESPAFEVFSALAGELDTRRRGRVP
jgi:hypothetical protein